LETTIYLKDMESSLDMKDSLQAIELKKKFSRDKTYLLSKNGFFLFRFANGVFGSKWCGIWDLDKKLIEYFAFKVGGVWLSPLNFKRFVYDGVQALHEYEIEMGKIVEKVCLDEGSVMVELRTPKKVEIEVEVGVNIRKRCENVHRRTYTLVSGEDRVRVMNEIGVVEIGVEKGNFIPEPRREVHFPGLYAIEQGYDFRWYEEMQEKFIPGIFRFRGKRMVLWIGKKKKIGEV